MAVDGFFCDEGGLSRKGALYELTVLNFCELALVGDVISGNGKVSGFHGAHDNALLVNHPVRPLPGSGRCAMPSGGVARWRGLNHRLGLCHPSGMADAGGRSPRLEIEGPPCASCALRAEPIPG